MFTPSSHTHDYNNDITNKPVIPTKTSQLTNDSNFATETYVQENTPQSDWNQNDDTAVDYVKNRTHYVKSMTKSTMVDGTLAFGQYQGDIYAGMQPDFTETFKDGQEYIVTFDDTEFDCIAYTVNSTVIVGNAAIAGLEGGNNEPFAMNVNNNSLLIGTLSTDSSHIVKIEHVTSSDIKKLDQKYIPDVFLSKNNPIGTGSFSLNRKADTTIGNYSFAEGNSTTASGSYSHAEGHNTTASADSSHAEGNYTTASGDHSHAEGNYTTASGDHSHAEGYGTIASHDYSHAEGYSTTASGQCSHAEGNNTTASSSRSHAEGYGTTASGTDSHAEGYSTTASGDYSHAEGRSDNKYSDIVTAENPTNDDIITAWSTKKFSLAKGIGSHVEGKNNLALSDYSHAEGLNTRALGNESHAEGLNTTALGNESHAEGLNTTASGMYSHAEGNGTTASSNYQHVQGQYNIKDLSNTYADIIGNGIDTYNRSNAATVDWSGNAWFAGDVYTGSTSGKNKDEGSKKLATEEYVNTSVAGIVNSAPEALDTLNELAEALGDDPHFATTVATQIGSKVDKVNGKGLSTNDYTTAEKNKLAGIAEGANNYKHPSSHPATMITEDSTHRFVTDAEKTAWNEKNVFIATYDTTTNAEMEAALDAGKIVFVNINNKFFIPLMYRFGSKHIFVQLKPRDNGSTVDQAIMVECSDNIWSSKPIQIIPLATSSDSGKVLTVSSNGSSVWSDLPTDTDKVDLSSAQTISGAKTFSADLAASSNLTVGGNITATGTITGSKVYNAVWNDYAEWFEKDNKEEIFTPGEICIWTGNGVTKSTKVNDKAVVGIVSDSYGHILGGEDLKDMEENNKKFVPIGLKGRVKCKVTGPVEIGDLIVTSDITGVGIVNNNANNGIIVGKALENSNDTGIKEIIVLI